MKQQTTTALILSALLLSTLAHGPLEKPHNKAHHLEHSRHHPSHLLRHHLRDNSQPNCHWVCPRDGGNGGLTVVVNQTSSIIGVVNTTASVAWAIDVSAHLVAVFNGSSGAVVLVNIQNGTGVYIAGGVSQDVWIRSHESFEVYINSLTSLKLVYQLGVRVGVHFTRTTISKVALEVIAGVLINLSSDFALQLRGSTSIALTLLLQISVRVSIIFKNSLAGFLSLVESTTTLIRFDILWFVGFLEGLGALFSEIRGGIRLLIERSVKLDLKAILVARTGIDVFILIVTVLIQRGIDVGEVLGGVLSSGEKLLNLLIRLGGNISVGLTGLLKVVGAILGLIHKRVTIQVVIDALIDFAANNKDGGSLKEELTAAIRALLKLGEKLNSDESLDLCWSFLKKLQDNKLIVNGVNLSSIILVLLRIGTNSGLELIVRVLVLITSIIKIQVSIMYLLFGLIIRLNTVTGIRLIMLLIPNIKIDNSILVSSSGNLLHLILKGVSETVIKGILKGEWKDIPVIGAIYTALSVAVKAGSDGKLELSTIASSPEVGQILAAIVAGLIAEIKGSGEIHWEVSSEASANSTASAVTEDSTMTESEESSSILSWSTEISGGGEVTEVTEVSEVSGESGGDSGNGSGESGHHDHGHGNGHDDHGHGNKHDDHGQDNEHGDHGQGNGHDDHDHNDHGQGNEHGDHGHGNKHDDHGQGNEHDDHGHGNGHGHDDKHDHGDHHHNHHGDHDDKHHHKERHHLAKGHERHGFVNHHHGEDKHHHGQGKHLSHHGDKHHQHSEEKHNLHEKQHKA